MFKCLLVSILISVFNISINVQCLFKVQEVLKSWKLMNVHVLSLSTWEYVTKQTLCTQIKQNKILSTMIFVFVLLGSNYTSFLTRLIGNQKKYKPQHWFCFGLFLFLYLCFSRFLDSIIPKCHKSCYSPSGK